MKPDNPLCVIVGGADIQDYSALIARLPDDAYYIFCDSGLRHLSSLNVPCHLVIGDFDSHEPPDFDVSVITLPRVKDDTDVGYAVKEALRRGFERFILIGVTGNRLDHTFGNISLLLRLHELGKRAMIIDDYTEIEVIGEPSLSNSPDSGHAFSNSPDSGHTISTSPDSGHQTPAEGHIGVRAVGTENVLPNESEAGDRKAFAAGARCFGTVSDDHPYFSLINLLGGASDISIRNAKYPLDHASIPADDTLGISNEPLPGQTAEITVGQGRLLLIRVLKD